MVEIDKKQIDRVSLNSTNRQKLDQWLEQINKQLNGMVRVTRTDLVNCLLEIHSAALTESEIKSVARFSFDEVRWLNSAMERLKLAKKANQSLSMEDLLAERSQLTGDANKAPRGRSKPPANESPKIDKKPSGKADHAL